MSNDQWKPIETAPDDDTDILVWDPQAGVIGARFDGKAWASSWDGDDLSGGAHRFTHWMPEPAGPKGRKQ